MKQFPLYMFFSYLSVCAELSGEPLSTDEHSRETKEQTISSQFQSCFHQTAAPSRQQKHWQASHARVSKVGCEFW